jgi:hypothetical protein
MYLTRAKRKSIVKFLFNAGIFITTLQGFLATSTIGGFSDTNKAILMGLISILSALVSTFYNYLHDDVPNKVAVAGLLLSLSSVLGGLNEFFKLIHIDGQFGVFITLVVSLASFSMQFYSKLYYQPKEKESADN